MKAAPSRRVRVAVRNTERLWPATRCIFQVGLEVPWRCAVEGWPEDLQDALKERDAIMEFDGGMPREEAERRAYEVIRDAEDAARLMGEGD